MHQLTPELAAEFAGYERVVFVDASVHAGAVEVRWLDPRPDDQPLTHHLDPQGLLALARLLDSSPDEAMVVSVPVAELEVGEGLSSAGARACAAATDRLAWLCGEE